MQPGHLRAADHAGMQHAAEHHADDGVTGLVNRHRDAIALGLAQVGGCEVPAFPGRRRCHGVNPSRANFWAIASASCCSYRVRWWSAKLPSAWRAAAFGSRWASSSAA